MLRKLSYFAVIAAICAMSQSAFADVKIKSKQTMSGQSYENTTYIKGKRQRQETMGGMMINITQCDLRRGVQINPTSQTYVLNPFRVSETTTTANAPASKDGVVRSGGTVTTTISIKDTGERKQMFGYTARHLIITMEMSSSPDACNLTKMKMETDGWYIDFEPQFDCGNESNGGYTDYKNKKQGCQDRHVMKTNGTAKRGYPVYEKTTMFGDDGKETMSYVNEVTELSKATLDASLFDIPQGYKEVSDSSQMYASMTASAAASAYGSNGANSSSSSILANKASQAANASATTSSVAVGPKKAGTIRIGIATVKSGAVGEGMSASDLAAAVQNTFGSFLKVPNVEVVQIEARLDSAIQAEAKQKECDFILNATVSHKKGGGGLGMFGKALGSAVSSTGLGSTGSVAGNIATRTAANTVVSAANMSGQVRSKDELSLDLKLSSITGATPLAKIFKAKAKSDGDDIITNVVEQAAQAIVTSIGK